MIWFLSISALLSYFAVQIYIRKCIVERAPRDSVASNPGRVKPNASLLRNLSPGLYPHSLSWKLHKEQLRIRIFIARQLWHGACNPAIVMQENPFIVAAYACDCDAVLLVRFLPESLEDMRARGIGLRAGSRLLSVNMYFYEGEQRKGDETTPGPNESGRWSTFRPYIAEFMSKDMEAIEQRLAGIPDDLWERTKKLGTDKIRVSDLDEVRWGNPMYVEVPRSYQIAIRHARDWNIPY